MKRSWLLVFVICLAVGCASDRMVTATKHITLDKKMYNIAWSRAQAYLMHSDLIAPDARKGYNIISTDHYILAHGLRLTRELNDNNVIIRVSLDIPVEYIAITKGTSHRSQRILLENDDLTSDLLSYIISGKSKHVKDKNPFANYKNTGEQKK